MKRCRKRDMWTSLSGLSLSLLSLQPPCYGCGVDVQFLSNGERRNNVRTHPQTVGHRPPLTYSGNLKTLSSMEYWGLGTASVIFVIGFLVAAANVPHLGRALGRVHELRRV